MCHVLFRSFLAQVEARTPTGDQEFVHPCCFPSETTCQAMAKHEVGGILRNILVLLLRFCCQASAV